METPRRRALGKGLEELFSTEVLDFDSLEEKIVTETPKEEIVEINIYYNSIQLEFNGCSSDIAIASTSSCTSSNSEISFFTPFFSP